MERREEVHCLQCIEPLGIFKEAAEDRSSRVHSLVGDEVLGGAGGAVFSVGIVSVGAGMSGAPASFAARRSSAR